MVGFFLVRLERFVAVTSSVEIERCSSMSNSSNLDVFFSECYKYSILAL